MGWQKLTKDFFSNCFKKKNVILRMVFSLMVSNPRLLNGEIFFACWKPSSYCCCSLDIFRVPE